MKVERRRLVVQGQVQGVGFRPCVFNLAEESDLSGFVRNSPRGVVIEIQGAPEAVDAFAGSLRERLPPLARITALSCEELAPLEGEEAFVISASTAGDTHAVLIGPDICVCPDCLADMAAPGNRRLRYPFTNCTNCGPRYTITRSIPYDRPATSMACFPMCPECLAEYQNPKNRRFHAQPNACPNCGPKVWLTDGADRDAGGNFSSPPPDAGDAASRCPPPAAGDAAPGPRQGHDAPAAPLFRRNFSRQEQDSGCAAHGDQALRALAGALLSGSIAAIKGLGGFHLACNARDNAAVARLRERKQRPHKPFAVMAADLDAVRAFARTEAAGEALLCSMERPIVICALKPGAGGLSPLLAPDTDLVGAMLPCAPLHFALFEHLTALAATRGELAAPVLVMTSGNPGGQPICLGNREALTHLGSMADLFLFHDRDILVRVDDSVLRPVCGSGPIFFRRARGYVPRPLGLAPAGDEGAAAVPCVLAVGAELKNSLCLTKGGDAFVSQHIGDMANLESAAFHEEIREHLSDLLRVAPALVVRDLHPDYLASQIAEDLARERGLPILRLQHHAAHAFALLAEHAFVGKALVLALDGTGLGDDGLLWGGEFLLADSGREQGPRWQRLAHLAPMDLPGGEAAIREPWRIAQALLLRLGLDQGGAPRPWLPQRGPAAALIPKIVERRVNCPASTSCGRLFDAVSALLGLCQETTYEGQAAIRLEAAQGPAPWDRVPKRLYALPALEQERGRPLVLDGPALFASLARDAMDGEKTAELALRFHHSLAAGLAKVAVTLAKRQGIRHVGLSGGCLQNAGMALLLSRNLKAAGLEVLEHRQLPPGDGCISLGQAYWGWLKLRAGQ